MTDLLDATDTDDNFSVSDLNKMQSSISSLSSKIESDKNEALKSKQSIENAISNRDSKIKNADLSTESDVSKIRDAEINWIMLEFNYKRHFQMLMQVRKTHYSNSKLPRPQYRQKTEGATVADIATLRAQIDKANAQVEQAKYNLELGTLISPIDGEITELNGEAGDLLSDINNQPFAVVLNRNLYFVDVPIEGDLPNYRLGQKISATFEALEGSEFTGEISNIAPIGTVDNNGVVSFTVRAILNDLNGLGGDIFGVGTDSVSTSGSSTESSESYFVQMTANVDFIISESKNVLIIPVSAVKRIENKPSVQAEDGKWIPVTTGFTDGKMVEVISGLKEGDLVMYAK